jgi:hypothetical protein
MKNPLPTIFEAASPLLSQLENINSLGNTGLVEIKPFRDWKGSSWRNKIFKMRLCNAGEMLDIADYLDTLPQTSRSQAFKLEIFVRSIYQIDSSVLITDEQLQRFNEELTANLTTVQYLRIWAKNLEQIVIERLNGVYAGLQLKQARLFQGALLCENCAELSLTMPIGAEKLYYCMGEIICPNCIDKIDRENFDFAPQQQAQVKAPVAAQVEAPVKTEPAYVCACKQGFDDFEKFQTHRVDCAIANQPPASVQA